MGGDSTSAFGPPPAAGDNFAISVNAESREQCDDLFAKLSEGGTVTMPPQEMFWGRLLRQLEGPLRNQLDGQPRAGKRVGQPSLAPRHGLRETTSSLASRGEETAKHLWELSEELTGHGY